MDRKQSDKTYFLIVLGDIGNSHHNEMLERIRRMGEVRKIMDNVYVLSIYKTENGTLPISMVRNKVAGKDRGYCLVITINNDFSSAWSLTKADSDYLLGLIKSLDYGKEE